MKATSPLVCAFVLSAGLAAVPALAASSSQTTTGATPSTTTESNSQSMNGQNASGNMHIAQKMHNDLSKAGFTDIHIMPSSFLVRAKDSSGNPVMMVVNPDSVTEITEENAGKNSASANTTPGAKSTGSAQPATPGTSQTKP